MHMGSWKCSEGGGSRLLSPYHSTQSQAAKEEHDPKPGFLCQHQGRGLRRSDRSQRSPALCSVFAAQEAPAAVPARASPAHGGPGGWSAWPATPWPGLGATGCKPACGALGQPVYGRHTPFVGYAQGKARQHQEPGQGSSVLRGSWGAVAQVTPQAEDRAERA